MMFYDPVTGRPHDYTIFVDGDSLKSRRTTEEDAQQHGWIVDDRPDAQERRKGLLGSFQAQWV